jgi:hypothetical protein
LIQTEGEEEALGVVIATSIFYGHGIAPEPLDWILLRVVLGDPKRFEFLKKKQVVKSCRVGGEAIVVTCFSSLFTADLVDPVAGVVAATCTASDVASRMASASASAVAAATSSSADAMR